MGCQLITRICTGTRISEKTRYRKKPLSFRAEWRAMQIKTNKNKKTHTQDLTIFSRDFFQTHQWAQEEHITRKNKQCWSHSITHPSEKVNLILESKLIWFKNLKGFIAEENNSIKTQTQTQISIHQLSYPSRIFGHDNTTKKKSDQLKLNIPSQAWFLNDHLLHSHTWLLLITH